MPFHNVLQRDALAKRLARIANDMLRAHDQGHDGRYYPSDEAIEDIIAAAAIVAEAKVKFPDTLIHK